MGDLRDYKIKDSAAIILVGSYLDRTRRRIIELPYDGTQDGRLRGEGLRDLAEVRAAHESFRLNAVQVLPESGGVL